MQVPDGNTKIEVKRVQSTIPSEDIEVNSQCDVEKGNEVIEPQSCDILVDQTCPGKLLSRHLLKSRFFQLLHICLFFNHLCKES